MTLLPAPVCRGGGKTPNTHCAMPSEQSFQDRIGRFTLLKEACQSMNPVFVPVDLDIQIPAQDSLLAQLNACCTAVDNAANDLKDVSGPRATLVKTIKERVTRALNRVQSNRAWAAKLPAVKAAADKLRNIRPAKSAPLPVPADPDAPVAKKRERGGQSYKDIEGHFGKFIQALGKCAGYDTGAPAEITLPNLTVALTQLKGFNDSVPEKEIILQDLQIERLRIFQSKKPLPDGSASLQNRWVRIKKAVAAQYGRSSGEYALVSPIKY